MNSLQILGTERLILRPLTLADAPAIFESCRDPRLTRFTLFETHNSIADALRFLNESDPELRGRLAQSLRDCPQE